MNYVWTTCRACGTKRRETYRGPGLCHSCANVERLAQGPARFDKWFWAHVDATGDCWTWTGRLNREGYGNIQSSPVTPHAVAHRYAYEALVGPILAGLTLDHLCRNRACVNPAHLEPVTHRVNILRGVGPAAKNARKAKCRAGHPFDERNTYRRPDGGRGCRACRDRRRSEYRKRVAA